MEKKIFKAFQKLTNKQKSNFLDEISDDLNDGLFFDRHGQKFKSEFLSYISTNEMINVLDTRGELGECINYINSDIVMQEIRDRELPFHLGDVEDLINSLGIENVISEIKKYTKNNLTSDFPKRYTKNGIPIF